MTAQERTTIVEVLSQKIQSEGFIRLNMLSKVFDDKKLDRSLYASTGPKRWIREQFPEFIVVGSNGRETVRFSQDPLAQICRALDEALEEDGSVLLAEIPDLLPHDLNYRDYTMGKKLWEWLPAAFPEFVVSEDHRWLYRKNGTTPVLGPSMSPSSLALPALTPEMLAEVQQMHRMAFMNWWSNNIRKLRTYNEELNTENLVKPMVAHRLAIMLMGKNADLVDAREEAEPRVAFDTGLKSATGSPIYCILILNPRNNDGKKQKWALLDFACPEEEGPLGQWLRDHMVREKEPSATFPRLEEQVRQVNRLRQELLPVLQDYVAALVQGRVPEQKVAEQVRSFEEQTADLRSLFQSVWGKPYPAEITLQQVTEQVEGKTAALQRLKSAVELFDTVTEQTEKLFVQKRQPVLPVPTPEADREAIHRAYDAPQEEVDFQLFEQILVPYRTLLQVLKAYDVPPELEDSIVKVLCAHFPEITYRSATLVLTRAEEDEWGYLRQLDRIEEQLRDCQAMMAASRGERALEAHQRPVTVEELLKADLSGQPDGIIAMEAARSIFPENRAEQLLVLGRLEELKIYGESYPEDPLAQPACLQRAADPSLPRELTYRAAADRLYRVEGNRGQLAEKYYILGLAFEEEACVEALLRLYREEGDFQNFQIIWQNFAAGRREDLENQMYYLSILCRNSSEAARDYVRNHIYLLYQSESLDLLLQMPEGNWKPEERQAMAVRLHQWKQEPEQTALEQAIVAGDFARIRELAADPALLGAMGYGPQEIKRIVQATESENAVDKSQEDYDVGLRLYRFQKNIHGLAERYMWKGIARNPQIRGSQLMLILAQESRWQECCRLYESYQDLYGEDTRCRQLYLVSRLQMDPIQAREYVRTHLQDCLWMMETMPVVRVTFQKAAELEKPTEVFYEQVCQLGSYLEDSLVASVVFMDRTLRECASESYAREKEVPEQYARRIGEMYRSDSYSKGMDAVSIGERAFSFFGSYRGVAEAFARFALPDNRAVELLWNVYQETGDTSRRFELLRTYPFLKEEHRELYGQMLFEREEYGEFLAQCPSGVGKWEQQLQTFVAELKLNPDSKELLPLLPDLGGEEAFEWFKSWGSLLTEVLIQAGRVADWEAILFAGFPSWLDLLPEEALAELVTGRHTAAPELLEQVQHDALAQGQTQMALYLYQTVGIGALSQLAAQYRTQVLAQIETASPGEKLRGLRRILRLSGAVEQVDDQIALLQVQLVRENPALSLEEEAKEIGQVLEQYPAEPEAVNQLLPLLEDPDLFCRYPVYAGLAQLAEREEDPRPVLRFFQRMAVLPETRENSELLGFVCRLFVKAFDRRQFPMDLLSKTEEWCLEYVKQYQTSDGILCLYFVEKNQGWDAYAAHPLRVLADQSAERVGEELGKILAGQLQQVWGSNLPSYFDLFKKYLIQASVEKVEQYIAFANLFSGTEEEESRSQALDAEWENRMLSESESNALVRLLYANPTEASVWSQCTKLPLQDNPVGYAKLLFLACRHHAYSWQECAEYCDKYEQWELLIRALLAWAGSVPADDVSVCRIYLEKRLTAYPDYFARWRGQPELLELSQVLSSRVKQSEVEYHATLRAVSLIAVKTGFPEAVDHLMERFGRTLLGNRCNLGVVMAAHLLLDGRYIEARKMLSMLKNVLDNMNYREMVDALAAMTPAELACWTEDAENTIMLNLILPDGNSPNLQQINTITYEGMQKGQACETAHVLCRVLAMFPNDYGVYNALFDLCCTEFEGFLPILHRCLRGLVRLQPNRNAQGFYRRDQRQYARMLAALDALLVANGDTGLVEDYDFSKKTGEYYRRVGAGSLSYSEQMAVTAVRDRVISALLNRSSEELARLSVGYRSCITGNWQELLRSAWEGRWNIQTALSCRLDQVEDVGFARSVLIVLLQVEPEQRGVLISWLREQLSFPEAGRPQTKRQRQLKFVEDFLEGGYLGQLENQIEFGSLEDILSNPFEDYSFSLSLREKYIDAAIRKDSEQLFALAWLTGALICHNGYQTELSKQADQLFEKGDDRHASSLYHAMYLLNQTFDLVHIDLRTGEEPQPRNRIREEYEARYRITALFSRDRAMMAKVGSSDFHVWSCINLVLVLAHSNRADEILRLAAYLSQENAQLAESLMRGLDPKVRDAEKLEAVDTLSSDVAKVYYCYVVKYPYNPYNRKGPIKNSFGLATTEAADEMNRRYVTLAQTLMAQKSKAIYRMSLYRSHDLLLRFRYANPKISQPKDPLLWSASEETVDSPEKEALEETPFFAEGLEPLYSSESVAELVSEHRKIQSLAGTVETKRELSQKIYQSCLAGSSQAERRDALLLLGSDCYYAALSAEDTETVNRTVLTLAGLLKHGQGTGYGAEEAKKTIPNGLFGLIRSFPTLSELLVCYGEHKYLFHYMRGMLDDPLLVTCVGQIYTVLDNLRNCYASAARENPETLRKELSDNYRQLENIETNRWMELKNKVQKLINDEINELDQRPILRFQILNKETQRPYGWLSGQVHNIGQAAANNIVIQASYSDNSHSHQYLLTRLAPGGQAVLEVDYDCAADTGTLEYYLNATFAHNGKLYTSVVDKGKISLGEVEQPSYPTDLLCRDPNGIAFQVDPETGEVYSPEFVGRKEETAMLRSLVAGENFTAYRSALIYGIRRTGKSSLLNYLATYIQFHCPQVLCVKTDCQNIRRYDPIQYVFVDRVLDEAEIQMPELTADSDWMQFRERWYSPDYCADQAPERLNLFYRQLKQRLGGRGVYLIIDEIDRLFQRVEENRQGENHRNLDGLFGALSEMLNQVESREAMHFVLCGSNWLIRYNLKGEKINQLFQRFGKQVIEVGKLPEEDMQKVIQRPYESHPELRVTQEAMQWIWNYTGGLVWHTKVLAETAIERAKEDYRCVVYPADVQQSIPQVVTDEWCKQFYEGCESGNEYQVIDAMQSLVATRNAYIHIDRIRELTGQKPLELQRTINILQALKVVARHPVNQQLYCFGQDIYRRYFRTQPSQYSQVPDEPDIFQMVQHAENNTKETHPIQAAAEGSEIQKPTLQEHTVYMHMGTDETGAVEATDYDGLC